MRGHSTFLSLEVTGSNFHFEKLILPAVFRKEDEKARAKAGGAGLCEEVDLTGIMGKEGV